MDDKTISFSREETRLDIKDILLYVKKNIYKIHIH